eukprot:PhM_4_TR9132/c0_g2_i1/m.34687
MVRLITVPFLVMLGVVFITVNPTLQAHAAPRTITFGISASMSGGAWKPGPRYTAGIHAAFKEARDAGGVRGDYDPYLRVMDDQYNTTMTNLAALFSDTTVDFVLGTVGTGPTRESEATYIAQNTVMIAPMMGYVPIHTEFHPYIVNVRASYGDEAVAMINLAVSKHMTRIGLLYLLGIVPLELYEDSMAQIGHKFTVVESYISGTSIDAANFARIVLERGSQALVIFCTTDAASKVIDEVARQSQANPTTQCLLSSQPRGAVTICWSTFATTTTTSSCTRPRWCRTQRVGQSSPPASAEPSRPTKALPLSSISSQWRATLSAASSARSCPGTIFSRQTIKETIFSTRMFGVDDVLLGPYSDNCKFPTPSDGRSSMCNCTQGMRLVDTVYLEKPSHRFVPLTSSSYSSTECYATSSTVHRPLILSVSDANLTHPLQLGLRSVHGTVAEVVPFTQGMATDFVMASIDTPSSALSSTHVDGAVVEAADEGTTLPSFAGLATVNTPSTDTRTLYLLPTAQHELHEAANTLLADTATPPSTIRMVAVTHSGEDWSTLVADMRRSVVSVGVSLSAARPITVVEAVTARDAQGVGRALLGISPHVPHVVVGLASTSELRAVLTAAATAATLMSTASTSSSLPRVVLLFNEAARLWSEVETCASDASCRLL